MSTSETETQMVTEVDTVTTLHEDPDRENRSSHSKHRQRKRRKRSHKKHKHEKKRRHRKKEVSEINEVTDVPSPIEHVESPVVAAKKADYKTAQPEDTDFEGFYHEINAELTNLRDALVQHQQRMVDDASNLIRMIPHSPQAYITRLCCCTQCCGRCCDVSSHQKPLHHSRPEMADVGTDLKEEAGRVSPGVKKGQKISSKKKEVVLDIDYSDTSKGGSEITTLSSKSAKSTSRRFDDSDETELAITGTLRSSELISKDDKKRALEAAREAKQSLMASRLLLQTSEELKRTRCGTPEDAEKRDLESRKLLKNAASYARNSRKAMAAYRELMKPTKWSTSKKRCQSGQKEDLSKDSTSLDFPVLEDTEYTTRNAQRGPHQGMPRAATRDIQHTRMLSENTEHSSGSSENLTRRATSSQKPKGRPSSSGRSKRSQEEQALDSFVQTQTPEPASDLESNQFIEYTTPYTQTPQPSALREGRQPPQNTTASGVQMTTSGFSFDWRLQSAPRDHSSYIKMPHPPSSIGTNQPPKQPPAFGVPSPVKEPSLDSNQQSPMRHISPYIQTSQPPSSRMSLRTSEQPTDHNVRTPTPMPTWDFSWQSPIRHPAPYIGSPKRLPGPHSQPTVQTRSQTTLARYPLQQQQPYMYENWSSYVPPQSMLRYEDPVSNSMELQYRVKRPLPTLTSLAKELSDRADSMTRQARDVTDAAMAFKAASEDALQRELQAQILRKPIRPVSIPSNERTAQRKGPMTSKSLSFKSAPSQQCAPESLLREEPSADDLLRSDASSQPIDRKRSAEGASSITTSRMGTRPKTRSRNIPLDSGAKQPTFRRKGSPFVRGNPLIAENDDNDDYKLSSVMQAIGKSTAVTKRLSEPSAKHSLGKGVPPMHYASKLKRPSAPSVKVSEKKLKQYFVTVCDRGTTPVADKATHTPADWTSKASIQCIPSSMSSFCRKKWTEDESATGLAPSKSCWLLASCSPCTRGETESSDTLIIPRTIRSSGDETKTSSTRKRENHEAKPLPAPKPSKLGTELDEYVEETTKTKQAISKYSKGSFLDAGEEGFAPFEETVAKYTPRSKHSLPEGTNQVKKGILSANAMPSTLGHVIPTVPQSESQASPAASFQDFDAIEKRKNNEESTSAEKLGSLAGDPNEVNIVAADKDISAEQGIQEAEECASSGETGAEHLKPNAGYLKDDKDGDIALDINLNDENSAKEMEGALHAEPELELEINHNEDMPQFSPPESPVEHAPALSNLPYKGDDKFWEYRDTTAVLFPESKCGVTIALACAGWIILLIFFTEFEHHSSGVHEKAPNNVSSTPRALFAGQTTLTTNISAAEKASRSVTRTPTSVYYCQTPFCVKEANYIASFFHGDPCDNFYDAVCKVRISMWNPMTAAAISTDTILSDVIDTFAREYIADDRNADVDIARRLLDICQEPASSDDDRLKDVRDMFTGYFGLSWPIEANVNLILPDIWVVAGRLVRDLDLHLLATVSVDIHPEKRKRFMVGVDEPHLLYRRNFHGGQLADLVTSSIQESLSLMAKNVDFDELGSNIKKVMIFISNLVADSTVRYLGSENYRVSQLQQLDKGITSLVESVFAGYAEIHVHREVLVKSPSYLRNLVRLEFLEPRSVLNYLGYRVLVHFGSFMSSSSLRKMRSMILGYSIQPYGLDIKKLCSREVERAAPAMYLRAFAMHQQHTGFDTVARMLAAKVEDSFWHGLNRLSWVHNGRDNARDSTDLRLARLKLAMSQMRHFYPPWILNNASYNAYINGLQRELASVDKNRVIQLQRALIKALQRGKIGQLVNGLVSHSITGSLFDTLPLYDAQSNFVFIPVAVMNHSIPTNSSLLAFHIARFGVRIFKGLLPVIYNDFVFSEQKDVPLLFSDEYQRKLQETVKCLLDAFHKTSEFLKSNFFKNLADVTAGGFSFLEQTVAIMQAFSAFQEMLNIKRIWKSDFRLSGLPTLSAEQLFFVYYAMDNCEASDDDYRSEAFETRFTLPPEDRVNFPLLQFEEFKKAFACPNSSPMAGAVRCAVVT